MTVKTIFFLTIFSGITHASMQQQSPTCNDFPSSPVNKKDHYLAAGNKFNEGSPCNRADYVRGGGRITRLEGEVLLLHEFRRVSSEPCAESTPKA